MSFLFIGGLLILGIIAGYFSGLIGIGGGVIIVPALIILFGFSQHMAQGTTLALLIPPIGILAVMDYYKKGYVDVKDAIFICAGFVIGGYLGGRMSLGLSEAVLRKVFSLILIIIGVRMFFFKV
ncbi:MAG TPA: sulfite exporter TauE/SafE family protein [Ferruginibacter sp.]|nr:sulfite exporter TauE/SafE family protein [Ferruginibacter sp.]